LGSGRVILTTGLDHQSTFRHNSWLPSNSPMVKAHHFLDEPRLHENRHQQRLVLQTHGRLTRYGKSSSFWQSNRPASSLGTVLISAKTRFLISGYWHNCQMENCIMFALVSPPPAITSIVSSTRPSKVRRLRPLEGSGFSIAS
jgi:hypothetical protein